MYTFQKGKGWVPDTRIRAGEFVLIHHSEYKPGTERSWCSNLETWKARLESGAIFEFRVAISQEINPRDAEQYPDWYCLVRAAEYTF